MMQRRRANAAERLADEADRRPVAQKRVVGVDRKTAIEPEGAASGKIVGAVDGAIKILRYLSGSHEPIGVSRIAKETRLNTSTAFNILRTLAVHNLVVFDAQSKTYALSLGIMEIARGATALGGDIEAARLAMERIAQAHGVTVTLWQLISRNRKVLVLSALTRNFMRIQMAVGQRLPVLTGATGRIFAAFGSMNGCRAEGAIRRDPLGQASVVQRLQGTGEGGARAGLVDRRRQLRVGHRLAGGADSRP